MSRLDLKSGFWHIPLAKECRKFTAFLYKNKYYQFKVVPFGLVTSLAAMVTVSYTHLFPTSHSTYILAF